MKNNKWGITSNYLGNKQMYRVFRLKDVNEVDHSGNREYATGYITIEEAEAKMKELNQAREKK